MWLDWLTGWFQSAAPREVELPPFDFTTGRQPLPSTPDPSYASLYAKQPAVRICVDFLARNIAQLGLHVYRRTDDDSRVRVRDHPIAELLNAPNPATTRYALIESLIVDLSVFGNAYWYVAETDPVQLVHLPASRVAVAGYTRPVAYGLLTTEPDPQPLDPSRMIHVRYANPELPAVGLSPLASLKSRMTEDAAADQYRIYFWRNYARLGGVIEQEKDGPQRTPEALASFRQQWEDAHTGLANQGKTAIMLRGMHYKEVSSTFQEAQYSESKKATREEVAALYMIPASMVGLLESANYSNMHEQHRQFYADCLPPTLRRIEQEVSRILFPLFTGTDGLYLEFNLNEKLRGSFEEQQNALRAAVGQPYMSVNEARARNNLTRLEDPRYDVPAVPLNVTAGAGQPNDVNAERLPAEAEPDAPAERVH